MKNKKLSIIIPIFNVEDYLIKCLDSVINQTYTNTEIILVNDGSQDKCQSICNEYSLIHNNIIVIHKDNGGLSSARNAGLDKATGEYIAFVDSDDWIDADMYKTLIGLIEDNNADIAACDFKEVYIDKTVFHNNSGNVTIFNKEEAINSLVTVKNSVRFEVWNKVFKRELIGDLRFKERQVFEDVFFDRNIFLKLKKLVYIDKPFYNYLKTRQGNTNSYFNENKLKVFKEFDDFITDLKNSLLTDTSKRFEAFALDFAIGLYCDAMRFGATSEIKDIIVKQHRIYHKVSINNSYIKKIKSNLFFFSPKLFFNLFMIKNIFKFN
ncbi:MAG: hypothetical protein RLY43_140 [Bacteroidota bacterium]|jgi:glycosyltransferase involved in cell wall biosynthesis